MSNFKILPMTESKNDNFNKIGKEYEEKGQRASKISNSQAALYFSKAADQYSVNNKYSAKLCLEKSIKLLEADSDFYNAAAQYHKIAEISLFNEEILEAINAYENASKYYERENLNPISFLCLSKAAYLLIDIKKYNDAILHLEKISYYYDTMLLTEFKGKYLNFEISLIKIYLKDYILMKSNKYRQSDVKLLNNLNIAIANQNKNGIDEIINAGEFTCWQIELLKEIKNRIGMNNKSIVDMKNKIKK